MRMKRSFMSRGPMFFGLAFDIKSKLTVASAAFVSAIISAAYMNWIDPEIANLQPLLLVDDSRCCYCRLWSICTGYDFRICFFVVDTFPMKKQD
jgi:hypothetical protein